MGGLRTDCHKQHEPAGPDQIFLEAAVQEGMVPYLVVLKVNMSQQRAVARKPLWN